MQMHTPIWVGIGESMNEIWKEVVGYEGLYEVSNLGKVRSVPHCVHVVRCNGEYDINLDGKELVPQTRRHGYLSVCLYGHGGNKNGFKQFSVHRLVAKAFVDNPLGYTEVNHIDEDKTNNNASNLEWISRLDNVRYGTGTKRSAKNRINNTPLMRSIEQYTLDGKCIGTFLSARDAGRQLNLDYRNIYNSLYKGQSAYGYYWKFA